MPFLHSDLTVWLGEHIPWSLQTFGIGPRVGGITKHIRKELAEIEAAPEDAEEWCDVAIMAFDGAWRSLKERYPNSPPETLAAEVARQFGAKLARIRTRAYPRPTSQDEPSEHAREGR